MGLATGTMLALAYKSAPFLRRSDSMEAKEAGVRFFKRQRLTGSVAGHGGNSAARNRFPHPQSTNDYSSVSNVGSKATDQRLSLERGFRRMSQQHDRARAMVLGANTLNLS